MFEISCKCGKEKKSFNREIGSFYIADCCEALGYDHLGNKAVESVTITVIEPTAIETIEFTSTIEPAKVEAPKKIEGKKGKGKK